MRKRLSRKAVCFLLSAWVLAWGIVPPAIRHAHEAGEDRRHRHDSAAIQGQGEQWQGADKDTPEAGSEVSSATLRRLVVHLHWSLLVIDFSVAVPENGPSDDRDGGAKPTILRFVDSVPQPALDNNGFAGDSPATVSPLDFKPWVAATSSRRHPSLLRSAPLCDRARHERSGVQLA
jgi:hypothetical protein